MERRYWIGRKRSALSLAREAASAEARLIHFELAGLYSVKAARSDALLAPAATPAAETGRSVLHLRHAGPARSSSFYEPGAEPGVAGGFERQAAAPAKRTRA